MQQLDPNRKAYRLRTAWQNKASVAQLQNKVLNDALVLLKEEGLEVAEDLVSEANEYLGLPDTEALYVMQKLHDQNEPTKHLSPFCAKCGRIFHIKVKKADWEFYVSSIGGERFGMSLVKEAFINLNEKDQKFIFTGICPECQRKEVVV